MFSLKICLYLVLFLGVASMGVSGCQSTPSLIKRSQMLMGTVVFVTAVAEDEAAAQKAVSAGFAEIRRLEELLSTWIPTSELSQVNAAAGREPVKVSPETMNLLERSLKMAELTGGGFNIAVGPAVTAWNISTEGRMPPDSELTRLGGLTNLSALLLNKEAGTVFLAKSGMLLDVGGIGKGFAADLAAEKIRKAGATAGVVALSGDIKTFGRMPDGHKFVFGIQHPRKEQGHLLAWLELEDEAVSTAGDYQRFFMRDGVRYHHILDPTTLKPARLSQSVTVVAKEGVVADGLDTGLFVMGPERGMALVESLSGVEAVTVDQKGRVWVSSGLQDRLEMEGSDPLIKTGLTQTE